MASRWTMPVPMSGDSRELLYTVKKGGVGFRLAGGQRNDVARHAARDVISGPQIDERPNEEIRHGGAKTDCSVCDRGGRGDRDGIGHEAIRWGAQTRTRHLRSPPGTA